MTCPKCGEPMMYCGSREEDEALNFNPTGLPFDLHPEKASWVCVSKIGSGLGGRGGCGLVVPVEIPK